MPPNDTSDVQHGDVLDVVVVGGGPGGSTAAALLAQQGRRVLLLEKARHPRFHIGESLLPCNVALFDKLGVRDQVAAIGMPKWGVEFVSPQHAHCSYLDFADAWDKSAPMSWQVRRADLDRILFDNAAARGAIAVQGCSVRRVEFDAADTPASADGASATVHAVDADGTARRWRTRFVVDASGRDTLLARQFGDRHRNPRHNSAAIFGHFSGAEWLAGDRRRGNISIFWFAHGWFWFIPLADGSTSVGAVCWPHYLKSRGSQPLKDFFMDTIALAPALAGRLRGATLLGHEGGDGVHATGNYAYSARRASGKNWLLLGDAFAFIDPVFSSGVYLAMANAFEAARLVGTALDAAAAPSVLSTIRQAAARRRYQQHVQRGPRQFSWFILRMTNPSMRALFMNPGNVLRTQEAVLSVLAGDVYGRSPIQPSLLAFKAIYTIGAALQWRASWAAYKARRRNIVDVGTLAGETVMQPAQRA